MDFSIAGKLNIFGAKVIQQQGHRAWVRLPDRFYKVNGETRWAPVVEAPDPQLKADIEAAVLAAWQDTIPNRTERTVHHG